MKSLVIAGIDYSMNGPAICVHRGYEWNHNNCEFHFRTDKKGAVKAVENSEHPIHGTLNEPYATQEERFRNNAAWAAACLTDVDFICLEGYAMGGSGQVFSIGENTGVLKQVFDTMRIPFIVPPPTVIKKFATSRGNAKKDGMESAFIEQTGIDIRSWLGAGQTVAAFNPSSDIIDSYFMAKYGFEEYLKKQ